MYSKNWKQIRRAFKRRRAYMALSCFVAALTIITGVVTSSFIIECLTPFEVHYNDILIIPKTMPKSSYKIQNSFMANVSGYSSDVAQTDSTPFITASGVDLRKFKGRVVANNGLKFGTKVRIAGEVFEVQDRMASRYGIKYFDIHFPSKKAALQWGRRNVQVSILQ